MHCCNVIYSPSLGPQTAVMVTIPVLGRLFWYVAHRYILSPRPATDQAMQARIHCSCSISASDLFGGSDKGHHAWPSYDPRQSLSPFLMQRADVFFAAQPIIRFCYNRSKNLFNIFSSPQANQSRSSPKSIVSLVAGASDFVDLCALFGYYAEEHVVQTEDGYLLGIHRLCLRREGEEGKRVNVGGDSLQKRVVYLHHGLLMNSEVWVALIERERCLPFMLVEQGYDVWVRSYCLKSVQGKTDRLSWETIVATNIRRSPFASPQLLTSFGTSPWTNLPFTIFRTASTTFLQPPRNHPYLMLAFPRARLKPSRHCPYIPHSMTKLTFSLLWPRQCLPRVFEMELLTLWSKLLPRSSS